MRHRPTRPPLRRRLRTLARQQTCRLLLGAAVIVAVSALMLTIPVVSSRSAATSTVALDSSSSATAGETQGSSPVEMGVDGSPTAASPDATGSGPTRPSGTAPAGSSATGPSSDPSSSASPSTSTAGTSASSSSVESPSAGSPSSGSSATSTSSGSSSSSSSSSTLGGSGARPSPSVEPAAPDAPDPVGQLMTLVNTQRAAAGCDALVVDDTLTAAAQAHSAAMRDRDYFGLTDPVDGSVLGDGTRAAMIARGSADPAHVLAGWLTDPTDEAAILDCRLTSVGIGTADGDDGPFWTQLLA